MRISRFLLTAIMTIVPVSAFAGNCTGVEFRVNDRTTELEEEVKNLINDQREALLAAEEEQRKQILSSLAVLNSQQAHSGKQDATVRMKAEEASASAIVAAQTREAIRDRHERYSSTGYNACGVADKSGSVAAAINAQPGAIDYILDQIINKPGVPLDGAATKQWYEEVEDGDTNANVVFEGDYDETADYIDWLLGPPSMRVDETKSIETGQGELKRYQGDALRSVSAYLLAKIASESGDGGVNQAMDELAGTWTGTDGGEAWAASMAASPMRGVLLDLARIEAANLTAEIVTFRKRRDLELGMAAYALSRAQAYQDSLVSRNPENITEAALQE